MASLSCAVFFTIVNVVFGDSSYGPFNLRLLETSDCKGPRHRDCLQMQRTILPEAKSLLVDVQVLEEDSVDTVHVTAYKAGAEKSTPLVNLILKKPCEQEYIGGALKALAAVDNACVLQKGVHNFTVDIDPLAQQLWAGNFYYGNFTFRVAFYSAKCNFGCSKIKILYSPKQ